MNPELIKRLKSLAWRTGMVAAAAIVGYLASPETISQLGLPEVSVAFVGLILGEVSKYLNNKLTK
jgi:hypothetical protein